jgi:hypothetical protein
VSRFDRYLLSQLLSLFGFFALVLVAVYWVNRAVGLFDQLIGDGQSALVFLEFSILTLPNAIRLVLPIAAFAATVYVVNRLMQESELVVMQATGFSAFRLARPVLYFGLTVMGDAAGADERAGARQPAHPERTVGRDLAERHGAVPDGGAVHASLEGDHALHPRDQPDGRASGPVPGR